MSKITYEENDFNLTVHSGVAASVVSLVFKTQILSSTDSSWLGALTSMCWYVPPQELSTPQSIPFG